MPHFRGTCKFFKTLSLIGAMVFCASAHALEYSKQLQLSFNGQILTLLLRDSHVTAGMQVLDNSGRPTTASIKTYSGKIQGDANSWVRLTQSSDSLDGIVSRFGKQFRISQTGSHAIQIKPLADNHDHRVSLTNPPQANSNSFRAAAKSTAVSKVAKIALVVDSQYNAYHNGKGLEYALGLINSVDGIYTEEFGLALQVETVINVVNSNVDPFKYGNVPVENMLRNFRQFRVRSPLLDDQVSLVHLFTGNTPADKPVGLAWIDTACRSDGFDVGLSTPYKHDVLLVAHEIAHNLGALHDNETACAATTNNVMWPFISSGTSQNFSSCTVETVKRRLKNSCHVDATELELAASLILGKTVNAPAKNDGLAQPKSAATLASDLQLHESIAHRNFSSGNG